MLPPEEANGHFDSLRRRPMKSVSGLGASGAGLGLERKGTGTGVGGGLGPKHCMFLPMHCMYFPPQPQTLLKTTRFQKRRVQVLC
jgi:hypothetical protein